MFVRSYRIWLKRKNSGSSNKEDGFLEVRGGTQRETDGCVRERASERERESWKAEALSFTVSGELGELRLGWAQLIIRR